ncbi:PTS system mannose/fructose/sorbose family transporter subunit IID [Oenococcus oeni]|uniref:PTS system mannose/fructose/sorbose family transporter subunit IID n=1 Tax=Oenococcus oeni TaxID=1247 RepID=UPI0016489BC6|nr:PTS system mannose/fructose/sorbose family transporter subunit IID [Oenococcus oeni]
MTSKNKSIITKRDRHNAILRWMFMGSALFNYETQQATSVVWSLSKLLRKIYPKDDDYVAALDNHFKYFNTTTAMANIILGATTAMEEKDGIKSKDAVQALKTSLMGPFAGVGDTIIWVLLPTVMGSISGYMAINGNPLGAIAWIIINIILFWVRIKLFDIGYTSGVKLVTEFSDRLSLFTSAISVMGLMVVGTLMSTVVKVYTPLTFMTGKVKLAVQTGIFDKVMPALLSVLVTWAVYKMLDSKFWTPTKIIVAIIVFSLIGSFTGILGVMPTK